MDTSVWNLCPIFLNGIQINVEDMTGMFANMTSLESLPDLTKWNISKVVEKEEMFDGCSSLSTVPKLFEN